MIASLDLQKKVLHISMCQTIGGKTTMEKQNATLRLPKSLLREAKILAIKKETSLSQLLIKALEDVVQSGYEYERSKETYRMILEKGFDLGTMGQLRIKREDLHERR
jgi:hypothetical protein